MSDEHKEAEVVEEAKVEEVKKPRWDNERWRVYHRERYRRMHNVKPENQKRLREQVKADLDKLGEGAYKYHLQRLEKNRKKKAVTAPVWVNCPVCGVSVCDTEGKWRVHHNTKVHKIAQSALERHGVSF